MASDYYNVKSYGAVGDGLTNDEAAIEAAITAAETDGGGIVFFPSGVYIVDSVTLKNNCIYAGAGIGATIIRKTGSSPTNHVGLFHMALTGSDITNIVIRDLQFEQLQAVSGRCILLYTDGETRNVTIQRCYLYCSEDIANATPLQLGLSGHGLTARNVRLLDCTFEAAANAVSINFACFINHDSRHNDASTSLVVERCEFKNGREGYTQGAGGTPNVLYFAHNLVHGQTRRGANFYHGNHSRVIANTFRQIIALPFPGAPSVGGSDNGAVWMDVAAPGLVWRTSLFTHNVIRGVIGNGLCAEEMHGSDLSSNTIVAIRKRSTTISSISGDGSTVTVTVANAAMFVLDATIRIAGTINFNGDHIITAVDVGANTVQYADAVTGSEMTGLATCVYVGNGGNTSEGGHGILLTGGCIGTKITNCRIENVEGAGILMCRDFGPHLNAPIANLHIAGNTFNQIGEHGIWLDGEFSSVPGYHRIISNTFSAIGGGAAPWAAIYSHDATGFGGNLFIGFNMFFGGYHGYYRHDKGARTLIFFPIANRAASQQGEANALIIGNWFAVNSAGYAVHHRDMIGAIVGNRFQTGLISVGASNSQVVVADNMGIAMEAFGTVSDTTDGNGNLVVTHGLVHTPDIVTLTLVGNLPYEATVQEIGATTFTIRVRNSTNNNDAVGIAPTIKWFARCQRLPS
jgi:hypothetical protein